MLTVDNTTNPNYFTGCNPRSTKVGAHLYLPVAGTVEACPILPRSKWRPGTIRNHVWHVINQSNQNSCASAATAGAAMIIRRIIGLPDVVLSQAPLYKAVNNGRDGGSSIDDNLIALMEQGTTPAAVVAPLDWNGPGWPADWQPQAKRYRLAEAYDCPTFDAAASALQNGWPVVFGVFWGSGGHAITAVGLQHDGRTWSLEILNSWGKSWGDNGLGLLTEQNCRGLETFGAFALRSMILPSGEELPPTPTAAEETRVPLTLGGL